VFLGSIMSSETTAAAAGKVGELRFDPFAMLPFCGYNMGDYFAHWLSMSGRTSADRLPRIYYVNWFRRSPEGGFLWPGYGENSRVLKWVFERCEGRGEALQTAIGNLPTATAIDTAGLDAAPGAMEELLRIDVDGWLANCEQIDTHYARFAEKLPQALREELAGLRSRLQKSSAG
jgi:phosphoenolpyruvate carboxykinase (GTP)